METNKKRKNPFSAISINRITAERFRVFSKKVARSHSDTLENMMDFFEVANISPRNKLMRQHLKFYNQVISRLDFIVELIREQEKKYHKPTHDMLKSLFDGTALAKSRQLQSEKPKYIERTQENIVRPKTKIPIETYNVLRETQQRDRQEFLKVLNKIESIKPRFGKTYYKINITAAELDVLKRKVEV